MDRSSFYPAAKHPRQSHDFYPTPPELAAALLIGLDRLGIELPFPAFDPCAGDGRLLEALGEPGFGSDLFPKSYPRREWIHEDPIDARDAEALYEILGPCRSIVTNPPTKDDEPVGKQQAPKNTAAYRYLKKRRAEERQGLAPRIAYACMRLLKVNAIELFALLLPLPFEAAGSPERLALMRSPFFRARIVTCWRPEWIDGTGGGGKMNHAWFLWAREGSSNATVYVSRKEAMHELGVDEKHPRQPKARKPAFSARRPATSAAQLSLFDWEAP